MGNKRAARRTIKTGLGAITAGALLTITGMAAAPAGASTGDPSPTPYEGNLDCADLGFSIEFKINEQPTAKTYTNGTHSVTISNVESPGGRLEFDWSSPSFWDVVLVKQADGGLKYEYDPARTSDQDVQTVEGQNSGGISHVTFCSDGVDPTTSTTEETTTTVEETTTTAEVLGTVVTPTTAKPAAQVLGTQTLPRTGRNTGALTAAGASLVLAGASMLLIGGRRARLS